MTDIKQLAIWHDPDNAPLIAEIERLRKVLAIEGLSCKVAADIERQQAEIKRLRAVITRAKDALLDGQSTQWVHDLLVAELTRRALEPKP